MGALLFGGWGSWMGEGLPHTDEPSQVEFLLEFQLVPLDVTVDPSLLVLLCYHNSLNVVMLIQLLLLLWLLISNQGTHKKRSAYRYELRRSAF